jgi:hypothetical protein
VASPPKTPQQLRELEIAQGELMKRERGIKEVLAKATSQKEKDRLNGLLDELEKEKAEWKKKGV